jgi:membrane associated rhomboid family serine protease
MAVCYRHPSRETGVSCSSCGRPICPDCMTPTSVGMRCPECARDRTKVRTLRNPSTQVSAWQVLIALNVVVFLAEVSTGVTLGGTDSGWVWNHGVLFGPTITGHNIYAGAAGVPSALTGSHQYWRLLTSGFLHAGLVHIALNMLSLWFVGRVLEPAVGRTNFLAIYFASLFAGSFGALVFSPQIPTLGASTAIFGIFGALIVIAYRRGIPIWQTGLAPMLLINLVFTLTVAGISIGGHIGGVLAGFICGWCVYEFDERRGQRSLALLACLAVAVISVVAAIAVAGGTGIAPNGITI